MGSGTRFSWKFSGQCYVVFCAFSPFFLTELCSFWYWLKDLFTLHKLAAKVSLTIKNDDVASDRRGMDPYGRLRAVTGGYGRLGDEWVNTENNNSEVNIIIGLVQLSNKRRPQISAALEA